MDCRATGKVVLDEKHRERPFSTQLGTRPIFYAALHYVESFLADRNIYPETHLSRDRVFQQQQNLKPIYNQYRVLKTRSENARYDLQQFSPAEVRTLISMELEGVKSHILRVSQKP